MAPEIREFRAKTFSIRRMIFPEMAPKQYFFGVSFLDYWHRLKFATLLYVFSHACFHPYSGGGEEGFDLGAYFSLVGSQIDTFGARILIFVF